MVSVPQCLHRRLIALFCVSLSCAGSQYENHCPTPGPVYAGTGYTAVARAIHAGPEAVKALLDAGTVDVDEVMTGGARPLHTCGMSRTGQLSTHLFIEKGAEIDSLDCWVRLPCNRGTLLSAILLTALAQGYTPLHRMASNGLAIGAEALIKAGADVSKPTDRGETPLWIANFSSARDVADLLIAAGATEF